MTFLSCIVTLKYFLPLFFPQQQLMHHEVGGVKGGGPEEPGLTWLHHHLRLHHEVLTPGLARQGDTIGLRSIRFNVLFSKPTYLGVLQNPSLVAGKRKGTTEGLVNNQH